MDLAFPKGIPAPDMIYLPPAGVIAKRFSVPMNCFYQIARVARCDCGRALDAVTMIVQVCFHSPELSQNPRNIYVGLRVDDDPTVFQHVFHDWPGLYPEAMRTLFAVPHGKHAWIEVMHSGPDALDVTLERVDV